jgi:hypothetical protein
MSIRKWKDVVVLTPNIENATNKRKSKKTCPTCRPPFASLLSVDWISGFFPIGVADISEKLKPDKRPPKCRAEETNKYKLDTKWAISVTVIRER